jgi:thiamine-monophosphate kinase
LSLTAFGQGKKEEIAYRNGAKPHDLICVTGNLGAAYAGFLILDREKTAFVSQPDIQPDLSDYDYVIQRQLKPECRTGVLKKLRELGVVPTSMMDISDGLASELHHICGQSRCGATIYSDKLPIDYQTVKVGDEFDISAVTFALNGGEDYEFLFTVDLSAFDKIKNIPEVTIIGNITADEKQLNVILGIDNMTPLIAQGWKHF